MDVRKNLEEFIEGQTTKVRQKVRDKAIQKAESKLIYHGTKQDDLTLEDWEHVVAEEEKAFIAGLRPQGDNYAWASFAFAAWGFLCALFSVIL